MHLQHYPVDYWWWWWCSWWYVVMVWVTVNVMLVVDCFSEFRACASSSIVTTHGKVPLVTLTHCRSLCLGPLRRRLRRSSGGSDTQASLIKQQFELVKHSIHGELRWKTTCIQEQNVSTSTWSYFC